VKIHDDIEQIIDGLVHADPVYQQLIDAIIEYIRNIVVAHRLLCATNDDICNNRFHREVIMASMEFLQIYETWIDALKPPDFKHAASKVFHCMILRHTKGIIKAYRIWQIDLRK